MPHVTLHYSANLYGFDVEDTLLRCNKALFASGLFDETTIRSRAQRHEHFRLGVASTPRAFIHLDVQLLPTGDPNKRKALSQRLIDVVRETVPALHPDMQITAGISELDPDAYRKLELPSNS